MKYRNTFKNQDVLDAGWNFNDVTNTGFYFANLWVGSGGGNLPSISNTDKMGVMLVFNKLGNIAQLYLAYDGTIRYRGCFEDTWCAWTTK